MTLAERNKGYLVCSCVVSAIELIGFVAKSNKFMECMVHYHMSDNILSWNKDLSCCVGIFSWHTKYMSYFITMFIKTYLT